MLSRGTSSVTGQRFHVVPASNRMTAHWTALDGSGCTCLGHQRRGTCTRSIAAKTLHDRQQTAPAPKPRPSYADLFPACPCGDLADGKDGLCSRCASDREHEQRMDSRREHVATS